MIANPFAPNCVNEYRIGNVGGGITGRVTLGRTLLGA